MENDDAIVGRVLSRRDAFRAAARAGFGLAFLKMTGSLALADSLAATRPSLPLIVTPSLTEGPFFVDEKLNRSNLLAGTNRPSVVNGLPLLLSFTVYKMIGKACTPMKDAQVDVWHADALGVYSDESNPMNHEMTAEQKWLRGYQITDSEGVVQFQTIFPGWYPGRTPHIHFKIRQRIIGGTSTADFTSQVFFHEPDLDRLYAAAPYNSTRGRRDTTNENDNVYGQPLADGSPAGAAMMLNLQPRANAAGYSASFPLIVTDHSFESGRHGSGRGGPGFGPTAGRF